jgi:toxin ParE1/3/4
MAKIIFRQKAINDLNDIWLCTYHEWSEQQADSYYSQINSTCHQI